MRFGAIGTFKQQTKFRVRRIQLTAQQTLQHTTKLFAITNGNASGAGGFDRIVVEGNDDYSGSFLNKVVAIRANAMIKLDPDNFTAASLPAGTKLTMQSGIFAAAVANDQIIAEVVTDDQAVDGTITIYYTGGDTLML